MAKDVFIYDAIRTPRGKGRSDGKLYEMKPITLLATQLKALARRNALDTSRVDDIILGCVSPVGEQGMNIARAGALASGYGQSVAGVTLNRFCGSGLEAINCAAMQVASGFTDLLVAGGVESMSRVPMGSDGGAWAQDPRTNIALGFIPQGISADLIATMAGFRREDLDAFAMNSHAKAAFARSHGYFAASQVSVTDDCEVELLSSDELIRESCTLEGLGQLKPAFEKIGAMGFDTVATLKYPGIEQIQHSHTAGNSSAIADGASVALIGSEAIGRDLGLKPRARFVASAVCGTEPTIMLTGPAPATRSALKKAGLQLSDIDLFEVNEAFASVVLKYQRDLDIPDEKINVNGGAIAMGHPLGATGAMLTSTLIDELHRRKGRFGLVTLCIGAGMGVATVFERLD